MFTSLDTVLILVWTILSLKYTDYPKRRLCFNSPTLWKQCYRPLSYRPQRCRPTIGRDAARTVQSATKRIECRPASRSRCRRLCRGQESRRGVRREGEGSPARDVPCALTEVGPAAHR